MRFSIFSVLDYYEDGSRTFADVYARFLDQVIEAERLGFAAYWLGEHHGYISPGHALACPNPAIALAAAAQCTRRIGLNTAIANLALRHPLLLAEDYALLDVLSQGRLGLGIGRGSYAHEFPAFGQSREESRERFDEGWEIIQRVWRGETVTFQGRYYQIDGFKLNVLPVQRPLPRHWFSAVRAESFTALGRVAQPVIALPHLSADGLPALARLAQSYQQGYFAAGGDAGQYELPLIFYTCVASTRAEAQQQGREAMLRYLLHQHHGADSEHAQRNIQHLEARQQLWFGTPADLVQLLEQHQASVDSRHFVFWLDFGGMPPLAVQRSMRLLAREVMPAFF
jgi:alkanesulfonate monooxygenase SsuD/methylene tetrahydromethanopterin reductase-like flavin-dependent oxidoreductase (luciferase family)